MNTLACILAALPVALALYAYAGYPLALRLLAPFRPAPAAPADPAEWPLLSVSLPAYNEEAQLPGALDALLAADYPRGRLQLLVISDASTDATDDIARSYAGRGVSLLRRERRGGKTAAENAAIPHLTGSIVVNTDASIRVHPGALKALARRFGDASVGVVSGRDVSVAAADGCANVAETGYVGYEMALRDLETRLGGIVGASGCLYAILNELHRVPFPENLSRDLAAPLIAREHGYRSVSAADALCAVPRTASLHREFHRKTRTISRGIDTLWHKRRLLDPFRHGGFALKLWSHKLCRWAVPPAALLAVVALAWLAPGHLWAAAALAAAAAVNALAALGWAWPQDRPMPRILAMAAFPVWGNLAVIGALARLARGADDHVWEPTRRAVLPGSSAEQGA
ncbi:glycosyltransferase [Longimicrobium sp.]|uniref:glycosyltransferase n=1 Tax=Longimicrobium sp. TaxID=2029185 RepID=UPI002D158BC7|nr:glycosyltransferase [Longimicrobium sp.]HSU13280.1 glycosyltransferase [Longimicrobium sp.]